VSLSTKKRLCRGDVLPETDSKAMEMLRKTELAQKQALVSDKLAQGGLQAQRLGGQAVTADLVKPLDMVAAKHQLREQVATIFVQPILWGGGGRQTWWQLDTSCGNR